MFICATKRRRRYTNQRPPVRSRFVAHRRRATVDPRLYVIATPGYGSGTEANGRGERILFDQLVDGGLLEANQLVEFG
jgi:hypothetical protein